jgi:hypothetical protein
MTMFHDPLSRIERIWLLALRLSHAWRDRPQMAASTVDRLFAGAAMGRLGSVFSDLLEALDTAGARHLYIERHDMPGATGDERDLLTALRHCYTDDLIAAERALCGLLPPGDASQVLDRARRIAYAARAGRTQAEPISAPRATAPGWH